MYINFKDVVQHVCDYFDEHLPQFTVFEVRRQSYDPADNYLYMVTAKHQNGSYAVWTSWNESIQILNHGHYGLPDMKSCAEIMTEYQNAQSTNQMENCTPSECLQELLIKHDDTFEDSYQQIVFVTGFVDGIAAQREQKWSQLAETEINALYQETVEE